ncbi:hypothetical protein [Tabrizicola sp.]|uniref:hypothetical protein n=1 Tax=Tabrizicola sp. TaxID=2005166 RepID=UPI0025D4D48A|nr:hypothetical protein [Tabrizicola sp.]
MSRRKAVAAAAAIAASPQIAVQAGTAAPATEATPKPEAEATQAADDANTTESTLGDGDATGAAQEAPSATAAPQAPAPDVVKPAAKVKAHVLRVTGPAKGRWRAGRKFGPEPVDIPVAELTEDDLAKLEGDPELVVALVPQD